MIDVVNLPSCVHILQLTENKMHELWDKLKDFDVLYSTSTRGDEFGFYKRLLSSDTVVFETDGGVMILDHIVPGEYAQVHVSFWDKQLFKRVEMLRTTMKWAVQIFDLERLEAFIPTFSKALERFLVKRMGFTYEGKMRKRLLYQGEFKDILIYSILREEV